MYNTIIPLYLFRLFYFFVMRLKRRNVTFMRGTFDISVK